MNEEWDKEKYPNKKAWEVAVHRVVRARRYALLFPQFIFTGDEKYQDIGWQYEHEGLPTERKPATYLIR